MSKVLAELLEAKEPYFTQSLRELEANSFHPAVDIRLTTEVELAALHKLRELGLDPRDTNGPELYQSLQDLVALHDTFLARALGVDDPTDLQVLLPKLLKILQMLPIYKNCWGMKHSTLRRLLKEDTPKKTMKALGYRSVDSMLKREHAALVLAAARLTESHQWQNRFTKSYVSLDSADFEVRQMEVLLPMSPHWKELADEHTQKSHNNVVQLRELGVAVVLPMSDTHLRGASITLLSILLHAINELRLFSTFFKMQQVKPHFGNVIAEVLLHDTPSFATLAGQQLHLRVLHKFFGRKHASMAAVFEPHVQLEDLEWRQAEQVLYRIEPALKFWEGLDGTGLVRDGRPVSFNLLDNALNFCNGLEYGKHTAKHMQTSLWDELYVRYLEQDNFSEQISEQLESRPGQEILQLRHGVMT